MPKRTVQNDHITALESAVMALGEAGDAEPQQAVDGLLSLVEEARELGAQTAYARACLHLARHLRRLARLPEALDWSRQAMEVMATLSDPEGEVEALRIAATIWATAGLIEEAREAFERCIHQARSAGLDSSLGPLMAGLAFTYGVQNRAEEYADLTQAALVHLETLGNVSQLAQGYCNLGGGLARIAGREHDSAVAYARALALAEPLDLFTIAGLSKGGLGELAAHRGDMDEARQYFAEARKIFSRVRPSYDACRQTSTWSEYLCRAGLHEEGLALVDEYLPQANEGGFHAVAFSLEGCRIAHLRALGRLPEAIESLQRQLERQERLFEERQHQISLRQTLLQPVTASSPGAVGRVAELEAELTRVRQRLAQERQAHDALVRQATLDPLTGLANRRALLAPGERAAGRRSLEEPGTMVLALDLDHFKELNDRYGHAGGDAALVECARRLRHLMPRRAMIARLGGEEFVAVLPRTARTEAEALAESVRSRFESTPVEVGGAAVNLTVSGGLVELGEGETLEAAIARADALTYAAKRAGRNRIVTDLPESELVASAFGPVRRAPGLAS